MRKGKKTILPVVLALCTAVAGYGAVSSGSPEKNVQESFRKETADDRIEELAEAKNFSTAEALEKGSLDVSSIPAFDGSPYVVVDDNVPDFPAEDVTTTSFEQYSALDALGRCGAAYANLGQDLMPTEKRGAIGGVKPTGWHTVKYEGIDGNYLYNRCHLIGYQLTAENDNEKNLITGTRYLNTEGMLPFENMVADYIKETNHHVLYRVTPVFEGDDLVAAGVRMEAMSVEDEGEGILFDVYCYNVQPGIVIDYTTGESRKDEDSGAEDAAERTYILNTDTRKFHLPSCSSVKQMKEENKKEVTKSRDALILEGYEPCKRCLAG